MPSTHSVGAGAPVTLTTSPGASVRLSNGGPSTLSVAYRDASSAKSSTIADGGTETITAADGRITLSVDSGTALIIASNVDPPNSVIEVGITGAVQTEATPYDKKLKNNADGKPQYFGEALPGTSTAVAGWRVREYLYSNGQYVGESYVAAGAFNQVWDTYA